MLAELHNKISQNGNNLSDRLEDQLTGDFFGTLRYLPFEVGMKAVLSNVQFENPQTNEQWWSLIRSETGYAYDMKFWPRHQEGEIDLLVDLTDSLVGIEVKYLSGISSEDEETDQVIDFHDSCNQLARYSRMLKEITGDKKPCLLFLAPYKTILEVKKSFKSRLIIDPSVHLGFLSWEDALDSLTKLEISQLDAGQKLIIQDLTALLRKKRFMRYTGMPLEIVEKTISNETYIFESRFSQMNKWAWPTKIILEEKPYVFSKK